MLKCAAIIFSLLATFVSQSDGHNVTLVNHITDLLDNILNHYDKYLRPRNVTGGPIVVAVDISVRSMGPISERDMEFSMDCYFRQRWIDDRLIYTGPLKELSLNANFLRSIWRPDTYVRNGKRSYLHSLTVPNILLRIKEDGTVHVSQRLTIKTMCPMFLKKFPMDVQACMVELGSMAYGTGDVVYRWSKIPDINPDVELSQYKITGVVATERNVPSFRDPDENVSTLIVYFKLQREQGYYMLQIYIPCILTVVMSWVSFWINKEASPARVALGVMTVLTMSTMSLGGRNELPRVSYSTALDTYVVGCFAFVFFALVEYAVINFAHFFHLANAVAQLRGVTTTALLTTSKGSSLPAHSLMAAFVLEDTNPSTATTTAADTIASIPNFPDIDLPDDDSKIPPPSAFVLKKSAPNSNSNVLQRFFACVRLKRRSSKVVDPNTDAANNNTTRKQNGVLLPLSDDDTDLDDDEEEEETRNPLTKCCSKKRRKKSDRHPDQEMDWIDDVAKVLFPTAYLLFNWFYWMVFYWLGDEIENIPAIRDTSLHILAATPAPLVSVNASM